MQSANNKFEEYCKNEFIKRLMVKVCRRYLKFVCTEDEMESLRMSTLWRCVNNFHEIEGSKAKFTSYLYRSIKNNAKKLKKEKSEREVQIFDFIDCTDYNPDIEEAHDILESLKVVNKESYDILIQKYFYQYTYAEIGQLNGYSGEYARLKIKKAIKLCRKIVYSKVGTGTNKQGQCGKLL